MAPWSAAENKLKTVPAGLDSTVIETRINLVRLSVPEFVTTARRLRDYLPPADQGDAPARGDVSLDEAAMAIGAWSRIGRAPGHPALVALIRTRPGPTTSAFGRPVMWRAADC